MALTADPVSTGVVDLVFRRTYAASPARVWAAWTDPARFARWFGPHDATMDPCELDVRPGGRLFFCHRHPAFGEVWVRGAYLVVEPPVRLVLAFEFADAAGHSQSREGFAGLCANATKQNAFMQMRSARVTRHLSSRRSAPTFLSNPWRTSSRASALIFPFATTTRWLMRMGGTNLFFQWWWDHASIRLDRTAGLGLCLRVGLREAVTRPMCTI